MLVYVWVTCGFQCGFLFLRQEDDILLSVSQSACNADGGCGKCGKCGFFSAFTTIYILFFVVK